MEQYWVGFGLYRVFLYEVKEYIQSYTFNKQSLSKIFDSISAFKIIKDKENDEGIKWQIE